VPSLLGIALCLGVSVALWRRKPGPAWRYATLTGTFVAWWCAGQTAWLLSSEPATQILISKFQYVGISLSPVMWMLTGLAYVGQREWLQPKCIAALLVIPLLTILAASTNEAHGLLWQRRVPIPGSREADVYFGAWFYVHTIYSYVVASIGSLVMAARFAASPLYRPQLGVALIGPGIVAIVNLVYLSARASLPIDPTPSSFAIAFACTGWAMVRHHFFRFLPLARGLTVEGLRDGLIVLDAQGFVVDTNPAARALIGSTAPPLGATLDDLLPELTQAGVTDPDPREIRLSDGRQVEVRTTPVAGNDGVPEGKVVFLRDVTEERVAQAGLMRAQEDLRRANRELERLALTDTLTGLANRRSLMIHLDAEFSRARRHSHPLSFVMMDIDYFKRVNDLYGHAVGDRVMESCGQALQALLRPGDVAARLGGDEFGVLLPQTTRDEAGEVAKRLLVILRGLVHKSDQGAIVHVTFSLGVSTLLPGDTAPAGLLAHADAALYRVKNSGRDGICLDEETGLVRLSSAGSAEPLSASQD
ncbi:MAG: diguanylate cyclase, partial [Vicinamibacteria bacterium]